MIARNLRLMGLLALAGDSRTICLFVPPRGF